jgi:hypothetical protein
LLKAISSIEKDSVAGLPLPKLIIIGSATNFKILADVYLLEIRFEYVSIMSLSSP